MRNTGCFKGKKITVVGLARSGLACANLLHDLGAHVKVTDSQDNNLTGANAAKLKSRAIKLELGLHSRDFVEGSEILVISPGVSDRALPVVWAQELNIPVISEIEIGWVLCPATVIAITGTNGKTTVTTLVGKILEKDGRRPFVCGNIGNPFCSQVDKMHEGDLVSLEVSSFQLEKIATFKPKVSVILNLSRNHLDRYKDMEDYLDAKKRIFLNQDDSDFAVLNHDDPEIKGLARQIRAKVVYFTNEKDFNPNQSAVLAVAEVLNIDRNKVLNVFSEFKGVEHRTEEVTSINGVVFINDSKATTVDATIWALRNSKSPVVLIAGGREKGNDYNAISELVRQKVKEMILIGEARGKIRDAFKGMLPVCEAATLEDAVEMAFKKAVKGDEVLFSPMCKSFDMFQDYEERGRLFKIAVRNLKGQHVA